MSSLLAASPQASALVTADGTATLLGAFVSEVLGTGILILLGAGVCAAVTLPKSASEGLERCPFYSHEQNQTHVS